MKFYKTYFWRIIIFIVLGTAHSHLTAQSNKNIPSKWIVDIGFHYHYIFGNTVLPYDSITKFPGIVSPNAYAGFKHIPNIAFHAGILYNYSFTNNFIIRAGIEYFNHRTIFAGNDTEAIKKNNPKVVNPVVKNDWFSNSIELPVLMEYLKNKYGFFIGNKFTLLTISRVYQKHIDGTNSVYKNNIIYGSRKFFNPTIRFNRLIKIKKYNTMIYIASDIIAIKDYEFQLGIELPL